MEVRQEAMAFAAILESEERLERLKAESAYAINMTERYSADFWSVMTAFEQAARDVELDGKLAEAKQYARKVLFPEVLASPFLARIVERPIGVPGDYGMLGQILGNPLEGYDLFERILNGWILNSGAATAYRNRVALLEREIRTCVRRCHAEGRPAKILSMGSGVAYEVQAYLARPEADGEVIFSLVDFSEETLAGATRQFQALGNLPGGVELGLHRSSVIELANRSRGLPESEETEGFVPDSDYDLVYCAGLFDYLSDRMIRRVTSYLNRLVSPGGTLVLSTYTPGNPLRELVTVVLDWELIYRTPEEMDALVRRAIPDSSPSLEIADDEAEVYVLINK